MGTENCIPGTGQAGTRNLVFCNHMRSHKYYSSSILYPDGFLGYPCASYEEFQEVGLPRGLGRVGWLCGCWFCPCGLEQSRDVTPRLVRGGAGNAEPRRAFFLRGAGWAGGRWHRPDLVGRPSLDPQLFILKNSQRMPERHG
ncbi:Pancreatic lipase-related protein 2 [Myotis brandtii]|uniref:Pancreatic lipase-related protein 2 n=1 Tax=Myotis brandtii TaxID=109478 RepID=S7NEA8_MYOBR|nr:Pancreatic lipase-related protein 2 [Myotis brandtii]